MKTWYTSKTIWVALIILVASFLVHFGVVDVPLDPDAAWVATVWGVVQVLLRLITKTEVTGGKVS